MKIRFAGVGGAFSTPALYQSNMLVTAASGRRLLIDCGSDIRFSLAECGLTYENLRESLDAVYISHLHSDHIGGMEWLAISTYFHSDPWQLRLFMEGALMREMWNDALKAGLRCIEGKNMHLTDYFRCHPQAEDGSFEWENIRFTLIRMDHVISGYRNHYSYGLLIREAGGPEILITTDTQFRPEQIVRIGERAAVIFHDCETNHFKTRVHAHYEELRALPDRIRKKTWLYHYQPNPPQQPERDGFLGFVVKGREFEWRGSGSPA